MEFALALLPPQGEMQMDTYLIKFVFLKKF
jgi:hypothetical protein